MSRLKDLIQWCRRPKMIINKGVRDKPTFNTKRLIVLISSIAIISLAIWRNVLMAVPPITPVTPIRQAYIATSEFGGRLRIWDYDESANGYHVLQNMESAFYEALAFGDLDNDGEIELVGTQIRKSPNDSYYEVSLDIYKAGDNAHWEHVYSIASLEGIKEDKQYKHQEVVVVNVDGKPGKELVVKTHDWLGVYKYSETENKFTKLSSTKVFVEGKRVVFESIVVEDIDNDGLTEIVVSANDYKSEHQGCLLIFQDSSLTHFVQVPVDAHLGPSCPQCVEIVNKKLHHSLRVGDLDGDGSMEICSSGYRKESNVSRKWYENGGAYRLEGDLYEVYLFMWDSDGNLLQETFVYEVHYWGFPTLTFDVGDVDPNHVGDEIAYWFNVGTEKKESGDYEYYKLALCYFEESTLNELWSATSEGCRSVHIADSDGDGYNQIVVSGFFENFWAVLSKEEKGTFYLEIFDEGGQSLWKRVGGEMGENEVYYMAIG